MSKKGNFYMWSLGQSLDLATNSKNNVCQGEEKQKYKNAD